YLAEVVLGTQEIDYQGQKINLARPWARMTMIEAVKKYTGIDFDAIDTDKEAILIAKEKSLELGNIKTKGEIISLFFEEFVEKNLIQPTFIMDYPVEVSPLAKRKADRPELTERFEIF